MTRHPSIRLLQFFLSSALLSTTGMAGASTLAGRVLDPQGKAILGAPVRVEDEAGRV